MADEVVSWSNNITYRLVMHAETVLKLADTDKAIAGQWSGDQVDPVLLSDQAFG